MPNSKDKDLFAKVFETPKGKEVLCKIKDLCGYNQTSVCHSSNGKVDVEKTLISEGRRDVWLTLRSYITDKTLSEIEHKRGTYK